MSDEVLKLQEALRELIKQVQEDTDSPHLVHGAGDCAMCKALTAGAKLLPEYKYEYGGDPYERVPKELIGVLLGTNHYESFLVEETEEVPPHWVKVHWDLLAEVLRLGGSISDLRLFGERLWKIADWDNPNYSQPESRLMSRLFYCGRYWVYPEFMWEEWW